MYFDVVCRYVVLCCLCSIKFLLLLQVVHANFDQVALGSLQ